MKPLSKSQIDSEVLLARQLFGKGDPSGAIQKLDLLIKSNPVCTPAYFGKGMILASLGRDEEALDSFRAVLRYDANNADCLLWAAQMHLRLQKPDGAEIYAKRLTQINPKSDTASFILSMAYSGTGMYLEALDAIEVALKLSPQNPGYMATKAHALRKLQLNALAIEWYRKAFKLRPAPEIAIELAETLIDEGFAEGALSLLVQHTAQLPLENQPYELLARACTESQKFERGDRFWEQAAEVSTDPDALIVSRAKSEISSGRLDVAEKLLREGLADRPATSQFFVHLAPIVKFSEADYSVVQTIEQALCEKALEPAARQGLCYAIGKAHHDLGEYERAIHYYDEANLLRSEIAPTGLKFDRSEWKARIDFQIQFFTQERIASLASNGLSSEKPLFVVGMIRSGTTLVEQILSCHSQVHGGGESRFWLDRRDELANPLLTWFDQTTAKSLGREYLRSLDALGHDARFVVDKNPMNILTAAALHCVFPEAKIIHIQRQPVDNLLSIWMTPLTSGLQFISTREDLVFAYLEYLRLAAHLQDVLPPERFKTITYEQLTSEPESTIRTLLNFLGIEPEEACFHPERNTRTVRTPSMYQVRQPINTDSRDRWKLYRPWLGAFGELLTD